MCECVRIVVCLRVFVCVSRHHLLTIATFSLPPPPSIIQVSIVGIGHDFKTFDGEDVQQYIDLMDKDEIAEAPAEGMQE